MIDDKKISRFDFLKILGFGITVLIFNLFSLPRLFGTIFGQSDPYFSQQTVNNNTIIPAVVPETITTTFKVGINNDTFGGSDKYGIDMGYNQFSGQKLYDEPLSQPLSIDLSKPDPTPPIPYVTKNPQVIENLFQQIKGLDVLRMFLFEENEGLRFDGQNNNRLIGIDEELVKNVKKVLDIAHKYNIQVYFSLIDSIPIMADLPEDLPSNRLQSYMAWRTAQRKNIKSIIDDPENFSNVVLLPLLEQIKDNPGLFGIELLNEPNTFFNEDPTKIISDNEVKNFVTVCTNTMNKMAPNMRVSISSDDNDVAQDYAASTPISFADYHAYNDPDEKLLKYNPAKWDNKKVFLGEVGISHRNDTMPETEDEKAKEVVGIEKIVQEANNNGFMGALVYGIFDPKFVAPEHQQIILTWLKEFRKSIV